jgi:uncharacterized membrane protein YvbJ
MDRQQDNTIIKNATQSSDLSENHTENPLPKSKKVLISGLLFFFIVIAMPLFFYSKKQTTTTPDKAIAKVGNEYIVTTQPSSKEA